LRLVFDREVNVAWMTVDWSSVCVSVFNSGVAGLNRLLREWDVSTRDGVKVRLLFCNLKLGHDTLLNWSH
jgi:hypothetical protein